MILCSKESTFLEVKINKSKVQPSTYHEVPLEYSYGSTVSFKSLLDGVCC